MGWSRRGSQIIPPNPLAPLYLPHTDFPLTVFTAGFAAQVRRFPSAAGGGSLKVQDQEDLHQPSGLEPDVCPPAATVPTASAPLALRSAEGQRFSEKQLFLACCYQPAVRRGSAESQSGFSPFHRPELPPVVLVLNLHLLRSSRREQPVRHTKFTFGSSPPESRTPEKQRKGWKCIGGGRSGGVLSRSFPLRQRPRPAQRAATSLPS